MSMVIFFPLSTDKIIHIGSQVCLNFVQYISFYEFMNKSL